MPLDLLINALEQQTAALGSAGLFGVLALTLAFAVGSLVFLPRPALSVLAGLSYGPAGLGIALTGAVLGAALAFWLSRRLARPHVARLLEGRPRCRAVAEAVDQEGWRAVVLFRLGPLVPSSLQSYLFGLTSIRIGPYLAATALGICPGVAVQVAAGALGRSALTIEPDGWMLALSALGLLACAAAVVLVGRRDRTIMRERV